MKSSSSFRNDSFTKQTIISYLKSQGSHALPVGLSWVSTVFSFLKDAHIVCLLGVRAGTAGLQRLLLLHLRRGRLAATPSTLQAESSS